MKRSRTVFAVAMLLLFVSGAVFAQAPQPNPADPKYQSKGEQERSYVFPGTDEKISYHIYVPMKWDKNTKLPLVILTHGANQPATAPFQRPMANPTLAKTAEARGFIVAAVTGYHANATVVGGWNVPYPMVQVQRAGGGGGACDGGRFSARGERHPLRHRPDDQGVQRRPESRVSDGQFVRRQRRVEP